MSATRERLLSEMKETMKSGEKDRLSVIRMILSEIKNAEINDTKEPHRTRTEAEVVQVIAAYHKMLAKAIPEFPLDRQEPMKAELKIVEAYLPKQLSVAELKADIAAELNNITERNFGALMKHFQPRYTGRADGKSLSEAIKAALAEL